MARWRQVLASAIVATMLACGGLLGGDQEDAPPGDPVVDAAAEDTAAISVTSDASETPPDDGGCHPPGIVDNGSRALYGYRSTTAKTLDGVLDDFSQSCPTYVLTRTTAAHVVEVDGGFGDPTAKLYVEWEPDTLWIGVDVSGVAPSVYDAGPDADPDAAFEPRKDDSIEIYFSAKPDERDGDGLKTDWERQYIIDFLGGALQYVGAANVAEPFVDTRASTKTNGYVIEMKLGSDVILPLTAGRKLAFDMLLNVGTDQQNYAFLGLELHAVCAYPCPPGKYCTCNLPTNEWNDTPAFDTLVYPPLTLR